MKAIIVGVACFLLGVATSCFVAAHCAYGTAKRWNAVEKYMEHFRYPQSSKTKTGGSLPDPAASLAALVASGELKHVDLVFPNIPYAAEGVEQLRYRNTNRKERRPFI
jgi:hypothetical protein